MNPIQKVINWWNDVKGYELEYLPIDAKSPGLKEWKIEAIKK